MRTVHLLIHRL